MIASAEKNIEKGKYAEGADLLRRAVAVNPESQTGVNALYKLGFTYENYLGDPESAVFSYSEFVKVNRDPVTTYEVLKRIGNIHFELRPNPEKAIETYRKLIDLKPTSTEVDLFQLRIAEANHAKNNFEQARLEYQALIERFPKSSYSDKARYAIGNGYYMEGKYDVAIEALKQVVRLHPQSEYAVEATFLMGQCYEQQNKLKDALVLYEAIQGRYSTPGILEYRLAEVQKHLKLKK